MRNISGMNIFLSWPCKTAIRCILGRAPLIAVVLLPFLACRCQSQRHAAELHVVEALPEKIQLVLVPPDADGPCISVYGVPSPFYVEVELQPGASYVFIREQPDAEGCRLLLSRKFQVVAFATRGLLCSEIGLRATSGRVVAVIVPEEGNPQVEEESVRSRIELLESRLINVVEISANYGGDPWFDRNGWNVDVIPLPGMSSRCELVISGNRVVCTTAPLQVLVEQIIERYGLERMDAIVLAPWAQLAEWMVPSALNRVTTFQPLAEAEVGRITIELGAEGGDRLEGASRVREIASRVRSDALSCRLSIRLSDSRGIDWAGFPFFE